MTRPHPAALLTLCALALAAGGGGRVTGGVAVTVEYNDDAIGAVTMTTTPKSGYM